MLRSLYYFLIPPSSSTVAFLYYGNAIYQGRKKDPKYEIALLKFSNKMMYAFV